MRPRTSCKSSLAVKGAELLSNNLEKFANMLSSKLPV